MDASTWNQFNLKDSILLSDYDGITDFTIIKGDDGYGTIVLNYNKDINNKDINLIIDFGNSGVPNLMYMDPLKHNFQLTPTDN